MHTPCTYLYHMSMCYSRGHVFFLNPSVVEHVCDWYNSSSGIKSILSAKTAKLQVVTCQNETLTLSFSQNIFLAITGHNKLDRLEQVVPGTKPSSNHECLINYLMSVMYMHNSPILHGFLCHNIITI